MLTPKEFEDLVSELIQKTMRTATAITAENEVEFHVIRRRVCDAYEQLWYQWSGDQQDDDGIEDVENVDGC